MLDNAVNGHPLMQGVGMAALEGVATAGILHGLFHGGGARVAEEGGDAGGGGGDTGGGGCNSFQGNTVVATPSGEQAIDTLAVGSTVVAYDSATGKAVAEPVQHVFINHDTNLLDVTIATSAKAKTTSSDATTTKQQDADVKAHGSQAPPPTTETLHTTTEHPFLTTDRGFVDAALLVPGEQVRQLDGSVGTVVAVKVVLGAGVRYNLTVKDLHTYAVGQGQWVVHNTSCQVDYGSDDLSKAVQQRRILLRDRGGNYGAATLDDGSVIIGRSGGDLHAEEDLLNQASAQGKRIVKLFSERDPCAFTCAPKLRNNGITDVTWSWPWNGANADETQSIRAATTIVARLAIRGLFAR